MAKNRVLHEGSVVLVTGPRRDYVGVICEINEQNFTLRDSVWITHVPNLKTFHEEGWKMNGVLYDDYRHAFDGEYFVTLGWSGVEVHRFNHGPAPHKPKVAVSTETVQVAETEPAANGKV